MDGIPTQHEEPVQNPQKKILNTFIIMYTIVIDKISPKTGTSTSERPIKSPTSETLFISGQHTG